MTDGLTDLTDSLDDDDLELVGDLVHEGRDLLHQAVHRALRARLEQSRDGQRRDRSAQTTNQTIVSRINKKESNKSSEILNFF